MKRFLYILLILGTLFSSFLLISYSLKKDISEEFYVIPEARGYVIEDDREMSFDIYSKEREPLIAIKEKNSYLLNINEIDVNLDVVEINTFPLDDINLIKIKAKIVDITNSEVTGKATLNITNSKYNVSLDIGTISLLKPNDMELLSINRIGISDSYINNHLYLCGLNIEINGNYKILNNLRIGGFTSARLDLALKDQELGNVIEIKKIVPSYSATKEVNEAMRLEETKYFIPIVYKDSIEVIRESYIRLNIDNKEYYLDTFKYKVNDLDFNEYKDIAIRGMIEYARG